MANQEHLDVLEQGVEHWNQWRQQHPEILSDLSGADLAGINLYAANLNKVDLNGTDLRTADLSEADLREADLRGVDLFEACLSRADLSGANLLVAYMSGAELIRANLSGANLSEADLREANLIGACLSRAKLFGADLRRSYLNESNLSGAELRYANLSEAHLSGANLSKSQTESTIFAYIDLRETKGLVEIEHRGPSLIQLYTVQLPQDGSALHFLRGAGVPDAWINLYRAEMLSPIQYHSCFISYSSRDDAIARRLHADLQDQGVRCWFAPEDMKIGDKIRARIDEAIHLQDKLLLLLSEHAIASTWVEDEVEAALEKEQRQQREVLFPVCLDEQVMQTTQPWVTKLRRTRHIGNFTRWSDPQAYQQAFERLLRDLKAEPELGEK